MYVRTRHLQRVALGLGLLVLMLALAACSGGHEVVYSCTGTATEVSVRYTDADGASVEETVSLPWQVSLSFRANSFDLELNAENNTDQGDLSCEIRVDGDSIASVAGEESISISGSYAKQGNTVSQNVSTRFTNRETAAEPETPPEASLPPASSRIEIRNFNEVAICALHFRETNLDDPPPWSQNLAADEPIPGGETRQFPLALPGEYDFKAEDCEGNILGFLVGADLPADAYIEIYRTADSEQLTVVNQSSEDLCGLYVGLGDTLVDMLTGGRPIAAGSSMRIVLPAGPLWNLRVESCNGNINTLTGLQMPSGQNMDWTITDETLAAGGEVPAMDAKAIVLEVINATATPLCEVYLNAASRGAWGTNRVPEGEPIQPSGSLFIRNIPVDIYNLKVVDCEGNIVAWSLNTEYDRLVEQYGLALSYTVDGEPNVAILNHSSLPICGVAIRPTGTETWLPNLLNTDQTIESGEELRLYIPAL
ncbi:MAG TPA: hypothetical protein ENI95_14610, partial [Chloroflexi bacterium]|nr:hypothetical protein [Chloroflexota bacterium]